MAARINGVIETSDRIRQSYQPKPPRVVIDTSYVEQADAPAAMDEIDQFAGGHADQPANPAPGDQAAELAMPGTEMPVDDVAAEGAPVGAGESLIDGAAAPQSMAGWRQLAQHFMAEARNEKAARLEVETLCEEAVRCAEEAQGELAKLRQAGGGGGASAADDKRIAEANLREADARKREAEALMREAAAREEAEKQSQLATRAEIGTKHAHSARREAEAKRDEAILRLTQLQGELQAARDGSTGREEVALAQSKAEAREAEARREIEAKQKEIENQRAELEAVRQKLELLDRDADGRRRQIEALESERAKVIAARGEAEAARDVARRQVAEMEKRLEAERQTAGDRDAMARRENEARTAEAAARREAEKSREQVAQLEASLEAERAKAAQHAAEIEKQRAEAAKLKAEVETQKAEAACHRAEVERLSAEAKGHASQRKSASAKTDEMAAELAAARKELETLRAADTRQGESAALIEEARAREAALRTELEPLRGEIQRLEQAAQKAELARSQANEARLAAELAGAEARGALEAVRETARNREAALERQVGELMRQVANLESAARSAPAPDYRPSERPAGEAQLRESAAKEKSEAEAPPARVYKSDPLARTSSAARFVEPRNAPLSKRKSSTSAPAAGKPADGQAEAQPAAEPVEKPAGATSDQVDEPATNEAGVLALGGDEVASEVYQKGSGGAEKRRAKRVPASIPAAIWGKGMGAAMACVIRDKSSSGALLEFVLDRYKERVTGFSVGDQLTLTIVTSKERTTVPCVVVRIDGRKAGVRFNGQFRTEMVKQKRATKAEAPEKKSAAMQLTKSLFGSGR